MAGVGRLAPSPTGLLHLGHARSFLVAWWHARSRGARLLLRLEDLDGPRVRAEYCDRAVEDLGWLGLDWDGEPVLQSTGRSRIADALAKLEQSRLTYPCTCSRGDIKRALRAPHRGDRELRYPGTCRGRYESIDAAVASWGKEVGIRLQVPPGLVTVLDGVHGEQRFDVEQTAGDFLVARRDGTPAYQLSVVVDDAAQGVTEVVRGDDLLPSAARQVLLQRALGLPTPEYFHLPLVLDEAGERLAKRHDALGLCTLRERGVDPRRVVRWAANCSGMAVDGLASPAELTGRFRMANLPRQPVIVSGNTLRELGLG